jgi:hypothetical protein
VADPIAVYTADDGAYRLYRLDFHFALDKETWGRLIESVWAIESVSSVRGDEPLAHIRVAPPPRMSVSELDRRVIAALQTIFPNLTLNN